MSSYLYLQAISPSVAEAAEEPLRSNSLEKIEDEHEVEDSRLLLPDVTLLKRLIDVGRRLVPSS